MDNIVHIKNFHFTNYKIGRKHLLRSVANTTIDETQRTSFVLHHIGDFLRLARIRTGLSIEAAAKYFDLTGEELSSIEQGTHDMPAKLVAGLCTKYGVEKDFEELYSYLRAASRPDEKKTFLNTRHLLEKYGWIRPKDW